MYWNWDTSIPYIFFKWWTAETPLGLGFAVISVFFLAFFYENVINLRARYDVSLMRKASTTTSNNNNDNKTTESAQCCSTEANGSCNCAAPANMIRPFTTSQAFVRSSLFAFSNFYSLFLMMIFMTYNAYLCIALVLGAGTGHFWSSVFIPESDILNRPRSCCN
jgi:solute carrier family 31 (copper transporter), member 1